MTTRRRKNIQLPFKRNAQIIISTGETDYAVSRGKSRERPNESVTNGRCALFDDLESASGN